MHLEVDATVAYGAGISGMDLTKEMSDDDTNLYNTYEHVGLPPTPIASPGSVSIDAVLNPEPGDWLLWVAVNLETGETRFATTNAEHEANKVLLREWLATAEGYLEPAVTARLRAASTRSCTVPSRSGIPSVA